MTLYGEAIEATAAFWTERIQTFLKNNFDLDADPKQIRTDFERMVNEVNPELAAFRKQDFIERYGEDALVKEEGLKMARANRRGNIG